MPTASLSLLQSVFIAFVQGVTELFPVSSLAHAVIIPYLFNLNIDINSSALLPFLTALHLGTALALIIYFWKDWMILIKSIFNPHQKHERKLLLLIITATIPAGILGVIFEKKLTELFSNITFICAFLIINGIILFLGEKLRKRHQIHELSDLTYGKAFIIGIAEACALLPGISRSGITMVGGLASGLKHEAAARFAFLLATPVILGAGLLEVPKLFKTDMSGMVMPSVVGGIVAGVIAYASTAFLMKYFKKHEVNSLFPFGIYCILLGFFGLVMR